MGKIYEALPALRNAAQALLDFYTGRSDANVVVLSQRLAEAIERYLATTAVAGWVAKPSPERGEALPTRPCPGCGCACPVSWSFCPACGRFLPLPIASADPLAPPPALREAQALLGPLAQIWQCGPRQSLEGAWFVGVLVPGTTYGTWDPHWRGFTSLADGVEVAYVIAGVGASPEKALEQARARLRARAPLVERLLASENHL